MHDRKADFIFLSAANDFGTEGYRFYSMNTGRGISFLDLEDKFGEEVMEYFRIKYNSRPNHTSFKGSANWIPYQNVIPY